MKDLCVRCGKPTPYDQFTPITVRRYFVEGAGQLCEACFTQLYEVPGVLDNKIANKIAATEPYKEDN